jgi:hypothetical protein
MTKFQSKTSGNATETEKYLTGEAKVKEALKNLTGDLIESESGVFPLQKAKSFRLENRAKSDELDSGCFSKNEALTNDVTPPLLK